MECITYQMMAQFHCCRLQQWEQQESMQWHLSTFNNSLTFMDLPLRRIFPTKKDTTVKLLIPQVFTHFFAPKDFFFPTHKAFFYPVHYSVCFPCRTITSFSTVVGSVKALIPERTSACRCSIIPLPVCWGAGLSTSRCLAR